MSSNILVQQQLNISIDNTIKEIVTKEKKSPTDGTDEDQLYCCAFLNEQLPDTEMGSRLRRHETYTSLQLHNTTLTS